MEKYKFTKFDAADYLDSDETIAAYISAVLEENNPEAFLDALKTVARAKGMTELAKESGLSREQLYRSFSDKGNPTLKTMLAVMRAVGLDLTTRQHAHP